MLSLDVNVCKMASPLYTINDQEKEEDDEDEREKKFLTYTALKVVTTRQNDIDKFINILY